MGILWPGGRERVMASVARMASRTYSCKHCLVGGMALDGLMKHRAVTHMYSVGSLAVAGVARARPPSCRLSRW